MGHPIMSIKKTAEKIYTKFNAQGKMRDRLLVEMRKVLKKTREAISAIHRKELSKATKSIEKAKELMVAAQSDIEKLSKLAVMGLVNEAEGEITEAVLLLSFQKEALFPEPDEIGVGDIGYLLGLGDFVGELRRITIDALKSDSLKESSRAFSLMEEVYSILLTFDFPRGLTPGIRKKTDVARLLVERTRADISAAIQQRRLLAGITNLKERLNHEKGA